MHCIRKVTNDILWVGANDRRLALFEGVYSVPEGVSYNSFLLLDEKTVLFDTVDKAVQDRFFENVAYGLGGRKLDYLVLQHIEPDHSAAVSSILLRYPDVTLVLNKMSRTFLNQFYDIGDDVNILEVTESDSLSTGRHELKFVMAPMVHWPEVMVTFDTTDGVLFSADAFGSFGALNGALFADEVDFGRDYLSKARRYYTNIVGKYGPQVEALMAKASGLPIKMICPLHGFVWRKNLNQILEPYSLWASYEPEEQGVMIAYASVYGNTENAAEILACRLSERGVKTSMFDVSVTPSSEIVAEAFRWSHLVFASTTYNMGIFVTMEAVINDIVAHNISNRYVTIIENGSWAPASGSLMKAQFEKCKDIRLIGRLSLKSSPTKSQLGKIDELADTISDTFKKKGALAAPPAPVDPMALRGISYGLYLLTAHANGKDNGCIVNTVAQVTNEPLKISVTVNKGNYTHDMIQETGVFVATVLSESAPFALYERFGLVSGKTTDKFLPSDEETRAENGVRYLTENACAMLAGKVVGETDCGTHTIFLAELTQAKCMDSEPAVTYKYYFERIKPKPKKTSKAGYVCKICGYVHEGDELPPDFICPLCKHGSQDFERL